MHTHHSLTALNDLLLSVGLEPVPADESPLITNGWAHPFTVGQRQMLDTMQSEIGVAGTRMIQGRIEIEHNARLKPYLVRGRLGEPGLFTEIYRTDPVAFKNVNEIGSLVSRAIYEPQLPASEEHNTELAHHTAEIHAAIMGMADRQFFRNVTTSFYQGFAPFELRWNRRTRLPVELAFREQATLERWIADVRHGKLIGAQFYTGAEANLRYVLPMGRTIETARMVNFALGATGLNFEGVSPLRPIVALRKLKELLIQLQGLAYQKWGIPIAVVQRVVTDSALASLGGFSGQVNDAELQSLVDRLENMRARVVSVVDVPEGATLQYASPTGSGGMPVIKDLMDMIDMSIALCFSNEGSMLGSQSFGSYAMAAVSDNKYLRAAPYYADVVAEGFDRILRWALMFRYPMVHELRGFPTYAFRFKGNQDSTQWIADAVNLHQNDVYHWPNEFREQAALGLGLSRHAFDEAPTESVPRVGPVPPPKGEPLTPDTAAPADPATVSRETPDLGVASALRHAFTPGIPKGIATREDIVR